jgi:hypothetical protein
LLLRLLGMERATYSWPDTQHPDRCPVSSYNELAIAAPAETVWAWLVRARRWPEFYRNARRIEIEGGGDELTAGVTFRWTTFNLRVTTTVRELEPARRLAWFGSGYGSAGYHSWTLESRGAHCHVITEETQRGFLPSLGRLYIRGALHRHHQAWLEGLARMASGGPPAA